MSKSALIDSIYGTEGASNDDVIIPGFLNSPAWKNTGLTETEFDWLLQQARNRRRVYMGKKEFPPDVR